MKKQLIILLIILAGCQFMPTQARMRPLQEARTGTEAINMHFIKPQTSLYENQNTKLSAEIRNDGASDTQGTYIFITEDQIVSAEPKKGKIKLAGRSTYREKGEKTIINTRIQTKTLPEQSQKYQTQIILQACYPYKTILTTPTCIDPDISNPAPKACQAQPKSFTTGQGGPVAITGIEPVMLPQEKGIKAGFIITLANTGTGHVIAKNMLDAACGTGATEEFAKTGFNIVKITASLPSSKTTLTCTPQNVTLTPEQETQVYCESETITGNTYTTPLKITADYGYMQSITTTLQIKKNR